VERPAAAPPQAPATKRTPEEIREQREAFLAAKAAKAAGVTAPPAPKPVEAAPVEQPAAIPVEAEKPDQTQEVEAAPNQPQKAARLPRRLNSNMTRREFLNYAWLPSIALFSLETVALSLWFAFPNFKKRQFGGTFLLETQPPPCLKSILDLRLTLTVNSG
jgi:hypothetical protein